MTAKQHPPRDRSDKDKGMGTGDYGVHCVEFPQMDSTLSRQWPTIVVGGRGVGMPWHVVASHNEMMVLC